MEFLYDTFLIFRHHLRLSLRNPVWLAMGLTQPVLYLALFGPLFGKAVTESRHLPAEQGWAVYVPGLLVQLSLFGSGFVGFGIIGEWRMGILERMRVTPVSRLALLLGRVLRDVVVQGVQSALLLALAVAFGLRAPALGVLCGLCFVLLVSVSLASLSYSAALLVKDEGAFAPLVSAFSVPMLLLSGSMLPMSSDFGWLNVLSLLTPFRYIVDAIRDVFQGNFVTDSVGLGGGVAVALVLVSLTLGTRVFRRENV